jgi:hypothetical protein
MSSQIAGTFPAAEWEERKATAGGDDIDEDAEDEVKAKATSSEDDEDLDEIDVDDV